MDLGSGGVFWKRYGAKPSLASPDSVHPTMSSSIEQQRASVQKQITSMTGKTAAPGAFFTVPWVDGMASRFIPPPCDPMATAELDQLIETNSKEQGVKPDLIRAVINQESGNRPCAVSSKGAQGLMQLMPETADELGVGRSFQCQAKRGGWHETAEDNCWPNTRAMSR